MQSNFHRFEGQLMTQGVIFQQCSWLPFPIPLPTSISASFLPEAVQPAIATSHSLVTTDLLFPDYSLGVSRSSNFSVVVYTDRGAVFLHIPVLEHEYNLKSKNTMMGIAIAPYLKARNEMPQQS